VLSGEEKQTDKKFEQRERKEEERAKADFISSPESGLSCSFILVMVPKAKPTELCKFYKTSDPQH